MVIAPPTYGNSRKVAVQFLAMNQRPANPRNPTAKICGRMTLKSALERLGNGK
jgi:hypothetical protein